MSPAASYSSLYASDKFYSDAESDDEYKDPIDLPDLHPQSKSYYKVISNENQSICIYKFNIVLPFNQTMSSTGEQLHVTMAIQRLQTDLQSINNRLDALEKSSKQHQVATTVKRSTVEQTGSFAATYSAIPSVNQLSLPSWFPFKNVNVATIVVILGWPFVAQYMLARLRQRPSAAI